MSIWGTDIELRLANFQKISEEAGVKLEMVEFAAPGIAGCYLWKPGARPRIILSRWLRLDPARHRSVFFEELGHHYTATEEDRRQPFIRYCREGREIEDQPLEKQALRWASRKLINDFEINWFITDGGGTLADFARRFNVTEELARERLNALQASNPSLWDKLINFMAEAQPAPSAPKRNFATFNDYPPKFRPLG